jgi:hypothetical protein
LQYFSTAVELYSTADKGAEARGSPNDDVAANHFIRDGSIVAVAQSGTRFSSKKCLIPLSRSQGVQYSIALHTPIN